MKAKSPFLTCTGACSTARTCTDSMGATTNLLDCMCGSECGRAQSAAFQELYLAFGVCIDGAIASACY